MGEQAARIGILFPFLVSSTVSPNSGLPVAKQFFRVQETPSSGLTWLDGIWEGLTTQARAGTYWTTIFINNTNGAFSGYYIDADFDCATRLELEQSSDTQAEFFEIPADEICAFEKVTLTRIDANHILYNARNATNPIREIVYGTLKKRPNLP